MRRFLLRSTTSVALTVALALTMSGGDASPRAQTGDGVHALAATEASPAALRGMVNDVRRMEDAGTLRLASSTADPMAAGRRQERLQQYHLGLPVVGGSIVRQTSNGVVTSILGQTYRTDADSATPALGAAALGRILEERGLTTLAPPTVKFLGMDDGGSRLVYEVNVVGARAVDPRRLYLDAATGRELLSLPLRRDQSAVGEGSGLLGDRKKLATNRVGGTYFAEDLLRPPDLWTLDVRSRGRLIALLDGGSAFRSDLASDSDNVWTDAVAVDAHTYLGWTYDYLFKRIGVRGLDGHDAPMVSAINVYTPQQCVEPLPEGDFGDLCVNAFWADPPAGPDGLGMMVFGNGIPPGYYLTGLNQSVSPLAGALDVVAHELTHGVTSYTSGLEYRDESGALNESFSDMVGTAVEAYFQPRGSSVLQADYLIGEEAFTAALPGARDGLRSMQSPSLFGDPDHYTVRYRGTEDNGGVHVNSGIPNHVYYLAIEGGTNRVSGLSVTGVGFANREQIERTFFRAFTRLLPVRATFSQARAATLQSARDLYASTPAVERAIAEAWTAVGVQ